MKYKIIKKLFDPLTNKPCWNIHRGAWKSAIGFGFGKPSLKIHEIKKRVKGQKSVLTKRYVILKEEWHIRFDQCSWRAYSMGEKIADNRSKEYPDKVARVFTGQTLKDVIIKPENGESIFIFDLGGRFETHPYDNGEQWDFFTPSGKVLTYRADGKYAFEPGSKPGSKYKKEDWKKFTV